MPKERLHIYLADELLCRCAGKFPGEIYGPAGLSFYLGAISPDIFFYDFPSFSLSPLGNALHQVLDREGISIIHKWIKGADSGPHEIEPGKILWALGFASHFLVDATWHPLIDELSGHESNLDLFNGMKLSEIELHRWIESEMEAIWLARSSRPQKYNRLLKILKKERPLLLQTASHYKSFLNFAGLDAGLPDERIVRCWLSQIFFLRLFANRVLGRQRDRLLSFLPTRPLGVLVTPAKPSLPAMFSRTLPDDRNPLSSSFMKQALTTLELQLCGFAEGLGIKAA